MLGSFAGHSNQASKKQKETNPTQDNEYGWPLPLSSQTFPWHLNQTANKSNILNETKPQQSKDGERICPCCCNKPRASSLACCSRFLCTNSKCKSILKTGKQAPRTFFLVFNIKILRLEHKIQEGRACKTGRKISAISLQTSKKDSYQTQVEKIQAKHQFFRPK